MLFTVKLQMQHLLQQRHVMPRAREGVREMLAEVFLHHHHQEHPHHQLQILRLPPGGHSCSNNMWKTWGVLIPTQKWFKPNLWCQFAAASAQKPKFFVLLRFLFWHYCIYPRQTLKIMPTERWLLKHTQLLRSTCWMRNMRLELCWQDLWWKIFVFFFCMLVTGNNSKTK